MTKGECARCGADESMFWYPYAFAVSPFPDPASRMMVDCQRFMLCDDCQKAFVDFMRVKE